MKYKIFIPIIICIGLFFPFYSAAQTVQTLLRNAEAAIERKDLATAMQNVNAALGKEPGNGDALCQKARVYYYQEKYKEAIDFATKAISASPSNSLAYNIRGTSKKALRVSPNDVLADLNKSIELDPKNYKAVFNRGLLYWDVGRLEKALSDMNRAIELAPNIAEYYYNRGTLYKFQKNYDKAKADYTKAIELDPKHDIAYANRAEVLLEQSKQITDATFIAAEADVAKSIAINPKNWRAYWVKSMLKYYKNQDKTDAFKDLLTANKLNPGQPEVEKSITNAGWNNVPEKLRMEGLGPIIARYKQAFEKETGNPKKQEQLEQALDNVPESVAAANPAQYSFKTYMQQLSASRPEDLCVRIYNLMQRNLSFETNADQLAVIEAEASSILASGYNPKYKQCVASLFTKVAAGHRYLSENYFNDKMFNEHVDKTIEWGTKANKVAFRFANGVLSRLGETLDAHIDRLKKSYGKKPEFREKYNQWYNNYLSKKSKIRIAEVTLPDDGQFEVAGTTAPPKVNPVTASNTSDLSTVEQQLQNLTDTWFELSRKTSNFKIDYNTKVSNAERMDRIVYKPNANDRSQLQQLRKENADMLASYKAIWDKHEAAFTAAGMTQKVKSLNDIIKSISNDIDWIDGMLKN